MTAVDAGARPALRELLRRHLDGFPGGCVIVTHDPSDIRRIADRVAVLENGTVAQIGTPDEILSRPDCAYARALARVAVPGEAEAVACWRGMLCRGLRCCRDHLWVDKGAIQTPGFKFGHISETIFLKWKKSNRIMRSPSTWTRPGATPIDRHAFGPPHLKKGNYSA